DTSSSTTASSAPSSTAEGSTAPSEASSASATPSASASANTQATNGAQSSTPSGARLIIYPVGIAIKNPTGSVVDSDTSTVRIVAIPDTTTTDYTKYVMKQVSTALPSTTTASASASASAVPSSSMSFSPSPSAPASEPAQEEKKPLSLGMNLDQIAKGDFSSIQGAWQSNARSLFVENNKAEWSVNGRAYAELSGLKYYGVQSRGAQGAATVTRENGALIMRWPDGQMLSFYPAGVKIPRTEFGIGGPNTPYLDTEDWKDRIVSGKPADGPGLSSTIMSRISDTPEYAKVSGGIAISDADPADYAPQGSFSGQGGLVFQIGTTNGKPNLCSINKVNGARCEIISEKQDAETAGGATGSYKASIVPTRPQASGGPVEAYFSYYTQSVYVAADTRATHKTLQVVQQLSADGITCAVVADSTVRCTETSGAGFLVSPHGVVRLPVQDKLYYFNSEFVTD
ncbi:MAG: DUF6287 domain-containing protein, partial [Rothia sp. (in: high G+C Gram-positive bacteria)]|uniref:DUF6287 domain-containing protein n=1 Tax=Rothia sp. (in: high G+C Gram-positive bacteria) TaxID=1885016 RepID=UPI0026DF16A5